MVKRIQKEDIMKMLKEHTSYYPGILAVVTSAVRGTTISSAVVDVRCSLYPNIHPSWYDYSPTLASVSMPDKVLSFFHG